MFVMQGPPVLALGRYWSKENTVVVSHRVLGWTFKCHLSLRPWRKCGLDFRQVLSVSKLMKMQFSSSWIRNFLNRPGHPNNKKVCVLRVDLTREGFPHGSAGKESACNAGDLGSKIPWRRERLPTPVFWSREFHDPVLFVWSDLCSYFSVQIFCQEYNLMRP